MDHFGAKARIELAASGLDCSKATAIYSEYEKSLKSLQNSSGIGENIDIQGWGCETHPFAEYPLLVRCEAGSQRLDVLGIGPGPHANQGANQPLHSNPPAASYWVPCGDPGAKASYALKAFELSCGDARAVWHAKAFGLLANPYGFKCDTGFTTSASFLVTRCHRQNQRVEWAEQVGPAELADGLRGRGFSRFAYLSAGFRDQPGSAPGRYSRRIWHTKGGFPLLDLRARRPRGQHRSNQPVQEMQTLQESPVPRGPRPGVPLTTS